MPSSLISKHFFPLSLRSKQKKGFTPLEVEPRPAGILTGFTLFEIIVATVIFSLIILGMLSVFVAGNKHIIHTRERMTSAELGKLIIDPMQMDVNQDTWGNTVLGVTGNTLPSNQTVNSRIFNLTSVISNVTNVPALRRVTTTIRWNEPSS